MTLSHKCLCNFTLKGCPHKNDLCGYKSESGSPIRGGGEDGEGGWDDWKGLWGSSGAGGILFLDLGAVT